MPAKAAPSGEHLGKSSPLWRNCFSPFRGVDSGTVHDQNGPLPAFLGASDTIVGQGTEGYTIPMIRITSHHLPFSPVRGPKEVTLLVGARRCDLAGDLDPAASTYGSRWDAKPSGLRPGHRGRHPQADGAKWPQCPPFFLVLGVFSSEVSDCPSGTEVSIVMGQCTLSSPTWTPVFRARYSASRDAVQLARLTPRLRGSCSTACKSSASQAKGS